MNLLKTKNLIKTIALLALLTFVLNGLVACGAPNATTPPAIAPAVIEDTVGGIEVLEQEFGECDESEPFAEDNPRFNMAWQGPVNQSARNQDLLEEAFPHVYSSINQLYPLQGSWRKSKAEIMDIVDRYVYSPELNTTVDLLYYFDMVLLVNVAPRLSTTPANNTAQRMQVLVRNGNSNNLANWTRLHNWPISSGRPCGTKRILTPTGVFKLNPSRIYSEYFSALWEGREMYETFFLYHDKQQGGPTGVAIHGTLATTALGRQDSGGCVRIAQDNSKCLLDTLKGDSDNLCMGGGKNGYWGKVPSFLPKGGEADPEFKSDGMLEVNGYRVLVAIYDDVNDFL